MFQIKDGFIPTEGYVQFDLKFISNNSIEGNFIYLISKFRLPFLHQHMIVWFSWTFFSICEIYGEYRTAGHLVFWKPWPAVELRK